MSAMRNWTRAASLPLALALAEEEEQIHRPEKQTQADARNALRQRDRERDAAERATPDLLAACEEAAADYEVTVGALRRVNRAGAEHFAALASKLRAVCAKARGTT